MPSLWIVYLIGSVLVLLGLCYVLGFESVEEAAAWRADSSGYFLVTAFTTIFWPILLLFGPFYLVFRLGKKRAAVKQEKARMWETLKK